LWLCWRRSRRFRPRRKPPAPRRPFRRRSSGRRPARRAHGAGPPVVEGMVEHQEFGLRVDGRTPARRAEPGVPDADEIEPVPVRLTRCRGVDTRPVPSFEVVEAGASHDPAESQRSGGERDLVSSIGMGHGVFDVGDGSLPVGRHPCVPVGIPVVSGGLDEFVDVLGNQRLEADVGALKGEQLAHTPSLAEPDGSVPLLRPP